MGPRRHLFATSAFPLIWAITSASVAQSGELPARDQQRVEATRAASAPSGSAERVVRSMYELVTFDAGTTPDWTKVRSLFLPQAVVVLRTGRNETKTFDVDGFIQDFVDFIEKFNARATGFAERVVRTKPMVFGDIAHVLVLYEASIPGSTRPPQRGVDSWQLARKDGRWRIVSVVNEIPTAERPIPAELSDPPSGSER